MKGYRKILIAVNGSIDVLKQGLQVAADEKCWVTVVKVIPEYEGDLNLTAIRDLEDVLQSSAGKAASEIRETARIEKALLKTRIEEGDIHEKIVEVAEDERCDLIVMGRNRTNWLRKLLGKNVIEKVISSAPCPVLVVGA